MLGLVGESGSGKTVTSLAVMRLVPSPPGRIIAGSVLFDDRDLLQLSLNDMRDVRGDDIAMVFQDPMTQPQPRVHDRRPARRGDPRSTGRRRRARARRTRGRAARPGRHPRPASARLNDYPHQLSGGMRQRVMLAIALAVRARAADRRRADDRARRHRAGADPRPAARAAGASRHGGGPRHPRPRRGRRPVRRASR